MCDDVIVFDACSWSQTFVWRHSMTYFILEIKKIHWASIVWLLYLADTLSDVTDFWSQYVGQWRWSPWFRISHILCDVINFGSQTYTVTSSPSISDILCDVIRFGSRTYCVTSFALVLTSDLGHVEHTIVGYNRLLRMADVNCLQESCAKKCFLTKLISADIIEFRDLKKKGQPCVEKIYKPWLFAVPKSF